MYNNFKRGIGMNNKFRCCSEKGNFPGEKQVRAFLFKDYSIEPHSHDFYELNIVLHGKGTHRIEGVSFEVKTGDVFVIPPMTVHSYFDSEELDVYHILMRRKFILNNKDETADIPGFSTLIEIEPFLRQHFSTEMFLHLSNTELIQLKSDLSIIEENGIYDTEELTALKNHTIWKILYWFSYLLDKQMYQKKSSSKYASEIIGVLEYIHHNYDNKITVDLLCRISFLSRSTFLRSFVEICKCTPMEYINRYRCEKAVEMIDKASLSKTQIANSCGFYDLSHMERTIKRFL